jgi:hypothetical protein
MTRGFLYLQESLPGGPGDGFTGGVPELFGVKNLRHFVGLPYYVGTGSVFPVRSQRGESGF